MEKTLETKQCHFCGASFDITDKDMQFYDKISPIIAGQKQQMPTPKLCPDCRMQRRMAFRNERKLYRRKCDVTGKDIISIYNPEYGYKVCDRHHWRSDAFDSTSYGREVDLSKSFFEQFDNLWKNIPNSALYNTNTVNTEYANHCLDEKNCYMIFAGMGNEDCMYGNGMGYTKSSMDLLRGISCELCYECINCINCFKLFWSHKCKDCSESYFLHNCNNCTNCIGCINLNNTSYCIENKQYTKEEYEQLVPKIIEHMQTTKECGEFFNPRLSAFSYNESVAQDFMTLTREEALTRGYKRQDNTYDPVIPAGTETIKGDQIPSDISIVTDDILKKIFICEISERPFRIIKQELDFYRKHGLPLPRRHPDIRHEERIKLRPKRDLHLRNCNKCNTETISVYPQDFAGKVYCETCYNKEIYG